MTKRILRWVGLGLLLLALAFWLDPAWVYMGRHEGVVRSVEIPAYQTPEDAWARVALADGEWVLARIDGVRGTG